MYQSGRTGDEAKKRKSPAKSGRVGITVIYVNAQDFHLGGLCVSTPDFKATSIHQLSKTSIPFAYLSNTVTNLCMHLLNSASPLHHVGIT